MGKLVKSNRYASPGKAQVAKGDPPFTNRNAIAKCSGGSTKKRPVRPAR